LYRHRLQGLRLGIDLEADTLISNSGLDAYRIARRQADESSSQRMAKDWSRVAVAIARKTRKRPTVLAFLSLADPARGRVGPVRNACEKPLQRSSQLRDATGGATA
jgi:hypothetical protein